LLARKRAEDSIVPSIQPGRPIAHKLPSRKLSREFIWFKLTAYAGPNFGMDFGVKRNKSFRNEGLRISISYVTGNPANWKAPFRTKNNSSEISVGNAMLGEILVPSTSVFHRQPLH
jgi:hypothetical protein